MGVKQVVGVLYYEVFRTQENGVLATVEGLRHLLAVSGSRCGAAR